jgi:hypothetical protein
MTERDDTALGHKKVSSKHTAPPSAHPKQANDQTVDVTVYRNQAFIEPRSKATIVVRTLWNNNTAVVAVDVPGHDRDERQAAAAGDSWNLGPGLKLTLTSVGIGKVNFQVLGRAN